MTFLASNQIHQGCSELRIPEIKPQTIALSFWSPPYFVGKDYEKDATFESWHQMLKDVISAHFQALKPGGFMVINIDDILCFKDVQMPKFQALNQSKQKCSITKEMILAAREGNPHCSRYDLAKMLGCSEQTIDRRLNGNNIRGGKHQTQTRVKLIGGELEAYATAAGLFLYDRKIWVKDAAWANSRWTSNTLKGVSETEYLYVFWKPGEYAINRGKLSTEEWKSWGYRQLWHVGSVRKNDDHEAKFPQELAERVIRLYSDEGDTVLDPFMGSGTTALAALATDRSFIGIEKEPKYVRLAKSKIAAFNAQGRLNLSR